MTFFTDLIFWGKAQRKLNEVAAEEGEEEASSSSADEDGDEDLDGGEEVVELDAKSASKKCVLHIMTCHGDLELLSAEAALARKDDVDIPGGWKVGDPYVSLFCVIRLHHSDPNARIPYAALAKTFSLIEATTKRLEKTALLTAFLLLVIQRSAKGDTTSLLQAVYLCINRVCHFH